jgi:hypothetical protein
MNHNNLFLEDPDDDNDGVLDVDEAENEDGGEEL